MGIPDSRLWGLGFPDFGCGVWGFQILGVGFGNYLGHISVGARLSSGPGARALWVRI